MITLLTLMASQPALAQCEPSGVAVFKDPAAPSSSELTGPIDTDEVEIQELTATKEAYEALAPIPVAIGTSPHVVALSDEGDVWSPLADCECEWDLDSAVNDESDISQSAVSTTAGDVDLARYFAPVDLVACESEERVIRFNCGDDADDWRQVKLLIAPSDIDSRPLTNSDGSSFWQRCSVQGGGCLSPQRIDDPVQSAVWLLFPLIGLGGLARRRD